MATPKKTKPSKTKPPRTDSIKQAAPKAAPKPAAKAPAPAVPAAAAKRPPVEKPSKKSALRDSILARKAAMKPIAFSLDEVRAIAKTVSAKAESAAKLTKVAAKPSAALQAAALERPAKPNHVKAASLADILGFNPKKTKAVEAIEARDVPEKFKRFHKLLMDMRKHLTEGIERHSEETLKRSVKEDAGDLSAYGQHMADAGTDTFDRDFALSLVSSEQEALSEIDAAIKRIRDGTYGICEITAKPISKERLLAVPFTRYSAEAQKQIERNRHHSRTQAGLFGEAGEEGGKIMEEDGGGDD
jgi:RNA polymerase-binding transcription factor DksA